MNRPQLEYDHAHDPQYDREPADYRPLIERVTKILHPALQSIGVEDWPSIKVEEIDGEPQLMVDLYSLCVETGSSNHSARELAQLLRKLANEIHRKAGG